MKRCALTLSLALVVLSASKARSHCPDSAPWSRLPQTGAQLAQPVPLLLVTGAIAAPLIMAPSGLDHELRVLSQTKLGGRYGPEPVSIFFPYVFTGGLLAGWGVSSAIAACHWQRPLAAMLGGVLLTAGTVTLLKVGTGRTWPNGGGDPTADDRLDHPEWATRFRPWREGLAAWPSGHTAVMVAAASALRSSAPELGWLGWLGYPLAAGVAAGMWLGDHHWASDVVSGALLGEAIGGAVGRSFVSGGEEKSRVVLVPHAEGLSLVYAGAW